jgi:hypothetical protein
MKFDELTYTVAEMMGPPQKLTIRADGAMRYESHSNTSTPDNPEIGVYEGTLSPAEMAALNHSVADPPFQSLPDHRGRVAAGDRYQRLAVSTGSGRDEVMIGTREPVDSQLKKLFARLDQVVARAMKYPKRTVRLTVSRAEIDDKGSLVIDFELAAGGGEPVVIVNPSKLAGGPGLTVRGVPDKSPAEFQSGEVISSEVEKLEEMRDVPPEDMFVQLAPGQTITARARTRIVVPTSQTYQLQLIYQNTTEYPERLDVLIGELNSRRIRMKVPAITP